MTGTDNNPALVAALATLKANYIKKLPKLRDELKAFLEMDTAEGQDGARRLAHRLNGTAGSFGLDNVSALGSALEKLLREEAGSLPQDAIDETFAQLNAVIEELSP